MTDAHADTTRGQNAYSYAEAYALIGAPRLLRYEGYTTVLKPWTDMRVDRASELRRKYSDVPTDYADATLVALAEALESRDCLAAGESGSIRSQAYALALQAGRVLRAQSQPGCDVDDDSFLFVDVGRDLVAVEHQDRLHNGVTDALVAVNEGVVLNQREAKSAGFGNCVRVELIAVEREPRR